jgi:hypothetical protein
MIKIVINNLLTEGECKDFISLGDAIGYTSPTVKTPRGEMVRNDIRNNGRAIIDNIEMANELFEKFKDKLPSDIDGWKLKGLNEQMKIYKYDVGQQFKMHKDVSFVRNENERSLLTMLIYLNEGYKGGETFFLNGSVIPETGKCLVFQQNVMHAGIKVDEGIKYAIRTDVMYEK